MSCAQPKAGLWILATVGVALLSCSDSAVCEFEEAAFTPAVSTPSAGSSYEPGSELRFVVELNARESNKTQLVELELWKMAGDEPAVFVWSAFVERKTDSEPLSNTFSMDLAEGQWAAGFDSMDVWQEYGVRTRFTDGGDACEASEWTGYQPFRIDDGSNRYFNEDTIFDVHIDLPDASYDAIDAEALPPDCVPYSRNYYPGTVRIEGEEFVGAGVRVKGGCGSARRLSDKAAFKINLSDYSSAGICPETRRLHGLKRITLNNQVQDASASHERLAYRFYDLLGVTVPRRAPARLYVNNELWGLYLHIESIDRRFLERRFRGLSAFGALYEGTYDCDTISSNAPSSPEGPATCFGSKFSGDCSTRLPGADPFNYQPLIDFLDSIEEIPEGAFYPAITQLVDFEKFLSMWAADSIINHWDGAVFDIMNNYRIYHDPVSGKWEFIPSGLDQSFNSGQRPVSPWEPNNLIARRCLEESACKDAFAARLEQALAVFVAQEFDEQAEAIRDQIAIDVQNDPRRGSGFDSKLNSTVDFILSRPNQVRNWLSSEGY